jgi:hypothetical protein
MPWSIDWEVPPSPTLHWLSCNTTRQEVTLPKRQDGPRVCYLPKFAGAIISKELPSPR